MRYSGMFIGALLSGALLAACGGHGLSSPTSVAPAGAPNVAGTTNEKVLYSFKGGQDGRLPQTTLIVIEGVLYGTTLRGGGSVCATYGAPHGCGTVFKIAESGGGYKVLKRFPTDALQGAFPNGVVADANGTLYGSTEWGGGVNCTVNNGCGTIFTIDPSGSGFSSFYKFNGSGIDNGGYPVGIIDVGGMLYGMTASGGDSLCACGGVFRLDRHGNLKMLHDFKGGTDGSGSFQLALTAVGNTLYGTTAYGGGGACGGGSLSGCGTIFRIGTSGQGYKVLYRFKGGRDGANPEAMISVNGTLFGVTNTGGDPSCPSPGGSVPGCGTIFKYDKAGGEHALYRFKGGSDGAFPDPLLDVNGTFYASTTYGGGSTGCGGHGCGTIISWRPGNAESVIYTFKGGTDGANPAAGLTEDSGSLFGTTSNGGGSGCNGSGCGTVFAVTP